MDTSIYLAKLVGPVMLVLGIFVVIYPKRVVKMAEEVLSSPTLLMISGILALVPGLAIVNAHNLWVLDWRIVLTLMGWIALAAGVARLLLPGAMEALGQSMLDRRPLTASAGALMALLGATLGYFGYFA